MSVLAGIQRKPIIGEEERSALRGALLIAELVPDREDVTGTMSVVANSLNQTATGGNRLQLITGITKPEKRTRFKPPSFRDTGIRPIEAFTKYLGTTWFSDKEVKDIHAWAGAKLIYDESTQVVGPNDTFGFVDPNAMHQDNQISF
ncbi:hypothetical protein QCA50_008498 [Cerrena zonata]|uniref:Uncharacterized protein n=1 Tax=Cerrena zonata TaxID=2478898 RepID=A0AAW0GDS3_9APHY